jgi:hypothetical protein
VSQPPGNNNKAFAGISNQISTLSPVIIIEPHSHLLSTHSINGSSNFSYNTTRGIVNNGVVFL